MSSSTTQPYNRRRIQRSFKMRGLSIQVTAVDAVLSVLRRESNPGDTLNILLDELKSRYPTMIIVTESMLSAVVSELSRNTDDIMSESVQLLGSFQMPKLVYEGMRRCFYLKGRKDWDLHATAVDKVEMFAQRYAIVQQRVLRQDMFRPKLVTGDQRGGEGNTTTCALTPVESLLGRPGVRTLLGMIVQVEEGRYYLEDMTAQVPLNLHHCSVLSDGFISENCIVLVEGELIDGILHAHKIGHPPPESRLESINNNIGIAKSDIFNAIPSASELDKLQLEEEKHGDQGMFVLLSDVHLDDPLVLNKLEKLLEAFQHHSPLPVFVFMGNFTSKPLSSHNYVSEMTALWDEVADIIKKFPTLANKARFVFIPGPADPPSNMVLPQGPIPKMFTANLRKHVKHATFTSNPCRIRYFTKEILFFRGNMVDKLAGNCILPPRYHHQGEEEEEAEHDEEHETETSCDRIQHGIKTILDQGHLCPVPLSSQPIYWKFDHALRLNPLPDAVILADHAGVDPYCRMYLDCTVVNPGSFPLDSSFVVFYPCKRKEDEDGMEENEEEGNFAVEFSQIE